jgi:hypothetical protein
MIGLCPVLAKYPEASPYSLLAPDFYLLTSNFRPFLRPLQISHRCVIVWLPQETIKQNPGDYH